MFKFSQITEIKIIASGFLIIFTCLAEISFTQCNFQYISNDTTYQDYIELIDARKDADEIVTIGSQINRGVINESIFNAPVFEVFDYCGNILSKKTFQYVGDCKLKHLPIPTHDTYKEEPVGNTAIKISDDTYLLADKATDTVTKESVLVIFILNEKGETKRFKKLTLDANETTNLSIKNVLALKDEKIVVILWNTVNDYYFYFFDRDLNFIIKKSVFLERGIRAINEIDHGEFIASSLTYDKLSFQFYKFDTSGRIEWMVTPPYNTLGSAREILIINNKVYVIGGASYGSNGVIGVILICDMDGTKVKEFRFDNYFCQTRFCSAYLDVDGSLIIGGYIQHCQSNDSSGTDVVILKIDTTGTIRWSKVYDFRNHLGTSGLQGKYNDYGGFVITKANDGGAITNGISVYNRLSSGGILHEDALLIKTEPILVTNTGNKFVNQKIKYDLVANLINSDLNIIGPVDLIKNWVICSLSGEILIEGNRWSEAVKIRNIESGMYVLKLLDQNKDQYYFRFIKI